MKKLITFLVEDMLYTDMRNEFWINSEGIYFKSKLLPSGPVFKEITLSIMC